MEKTSPENHSVPCPHDVYVAMRAYAAEHGLKMRYIIAEAIRAYLREKKRRAA